MIWKSNSLILKIIHSIKKLDKSAAQWSCTNALLTTKKPMASNSAEQILVYQQHWKTETLKLDVMTGDALSMVLALGQIGWWRYYRLRLPYSILN